MFNLTLEYLSKNKYGKKFIAQKAQFLRDKSKFISKTGGKGKDLAYVNIKQSTFNTKHHQFKWQFSS